MHSDDKLHHSQAKKTDLVLMLLGMIVVADDLPPRTLIDALSVHEQQEITRWCREMHMEAQTDPEYLEEHPEERAVAAPACLLRVLPKDHYLHTWRCAAEGTDAGA